MIGQVLDKRVVKTLVTSETRRMVRVIDGVDFDATASAQDHAHVTALHMRRGPWRVLPAHTQRSPILYALKKTGRSDAI